jgi:hypothetical protein
VLALFEFTGKSRKALLGAGDKAKSLFFRGKTSCRIPEGLFVPGFKNRSGVQKSLRKFRRQICCSCFDNFAVFERYFVRSFTGFNRFYNQGFPLTFTELEAAPGAPLTVFFPFHHTGITGKKTVIPQGNDICLIKLTKSPRDPVPAGPSLTIRAAAVYVYQYVKLVFAGGNHKGLTNNHRMFTLWKIPAQFFAVNRNFTVSVT